jgi:hypothetical protein
MKTLIIHPKDKSTDFLKPIYAGIPDQTVVTGGTTRRELHELIKSHDRIMMMGHGHPGGLFSVGQFPASGVIVGPDEVEHLRGKENIFIWCNADQFVKRHALKGFSTGMFISEVGEANWCGLPGTKQDEVDESNDTFAQFMSEGLNEGLGARDLKETIKDRYGVLADINAVAAYNNYRIYLFD